VLQKKDTIFLSHANPEDNPFTEWLYAQLTLAGYHCWCDFESLLGGERDFSGEIQRILTDDTCKYLLVFSPHTFTKDFVIDEYDFAKSLAKKNKIKDFIYPIRIADVAFETRIGLNRYNHFNFYPSWSEGLTKLLKRLHYDKIPVSTDKCTQILSSWATNKFALNSGIEPVQRKYFSNWWQVCSLPESIYVFQYPNETQAKAIHEEESVYPKIRHGNCVIAFQRNILTICAKQDNLELYPSSVYEIKVSDILTGYVKDDFPTFSDAQSFLKRLLKKSLKDFLFSIGMSRYKMSGKQDCFFYKSNNLRASKVKVSYPGLKTTRTLFGKHLSSVWHYGISFKILLEPFVCFSLKSHLVFSDNGFKPWTDEKVMFTARRKKGRMMFNREWRDFLMAMLSSFKDEDGKIFLVLTDEQLLEMQPFTLSFEADFDYIEPTKESRLRLLSEDFSKEEDEEFIETEINEGDEADE